MADATQQTDTQPFPDEPIPGLIVLRLTPGGGFGLTCNFELQRGDSNTGPWETIAIYPPSRMSADGILYADQLPLDGTLRWYRGRHTKLGWKPSAYSVPIRGSIKQVRIIIDPEPAPLPKPEYLDGSGGEKIIGDAKLFIAGLTVLSGSVTASSDDAPFQFSDTGKLIEIQSGSLTGNTFVTTIAGVFNAESISLANPVFSDVNDKPFRFGTDNTLALQTLLSRAANDPVAPSKVYLRSGSYLISGSAAFDGGVKIQDGVTLFGDGHRTEIVLLGPFSGPIIANSESLNRNISIRDIRFNADRDFHDDPSSTGSSAIKFDGVNDFELQNVFFESASADALIVSNSEAGTIRAIRGNANAINDISAYSCSLMVFDDINTTGSLGYGIEFQTVLSSSIANSAPSEEGSGSFVQDPGSNRNALLGVEGLNQKVRAQDIIAGRSGSLEEFSIGIVQEPFSFVVFDTFGLWNDESHTNFYGVGIQPARFYTNPTIYISDAGGSPSANRYGLEFPVKRGKAQNFDLDQFESQSVGMFVGIDANGMGSSTPVELDNASFQIRGDVVMGNTRNFGVANRPLFYRVTALSGSHQFEGQEVIITPPLTASDAEFDNILATEISASVGFHGPASGALDLAWTGSVRPKFHSIQHMQDTFHSAGVITGGTVITGSAAESIDVQSGSGFVRDVDDETTTIFYHDFDATSSLAIPFDTTRYIGINLNSGLPELIVQTTDVWDFNTNYPLAVVVNDSGSISIKDARHKVGDHANKMIQRMWETTPLARDERGGGLILGSTNRDIEVTPGTLWDKLEDFDIGAFDTTTGDTFDIYWRSASVFEVSRSNTQWDNASYDDGTGTLAILGSNRYANMWFYLETAGDVVAQYGRDQYTSVALAQAEDPPTNAPDRITHLTKLIGRIIFQEAGSAVEVVESVFTTEFAAGGVADHGGLAGLADDDHAQYLLTDGTRALTGEWETGNRIISELSGGFDGVVPTGSAVYHEQVDLGIFSGSFSMSFSSSNAQKYTAGGDMTIAISDVLPGSVNTLEIDNDGSHSIGFQVGTLWNSGIPDTPSTGSNTAVIQGLSIGNFVTITGKDIG